MQDAPCPRPVHNPPIPIPIPTPIPILPKNKPCHWTDRIDDAYGKHEKQLQTGRCSGEKTMTIALTFRQRELLVLGAPWSPKPLQDSSWLPDRNMTIYWGSYRLPLLDFVIGICCQFDFCGVHFD